MRKENCLVNKFIKFEEPQKLFEKKNNGISSWSFIRDKVFSLIQEATLDYSEKGKRDINSSLREIAIKAPRLLKNFFPFHLKKISRQHFCLLHIPEESLCMEVTMTYILIQSVVILIVPFRLLNRSFN